MLKKYHHYFSQKLKPYKINLFRAIVSGALTWLMVFSIFIMVYYIPVIKDSITIQGVVVGVLILPFASLGAGFYFKNGDKSVVLPVSLVMVLTAAILDVIITVPFIEIPYNGRGHFEFFTAPLFWILVSEIALVIYLYWSIKIKQLLILKTINHEKQ